MSATADYGRPGILASRFEMVLFGNDFTIHGLAGWASRHTVSRHLDKENVFSNNVPGIFTRP